MSVPNRIAGCLYGYAIGDALGLGTEFMTRGEISLRYPSGLSDYSQIIRDAHRAAWTKGSFTHDTEIILLLIESIIECGAPDHIDFARRYKRWFEQIKPSDLDNHLRWVLSDPAYTDDPIETAKRIYGMQSYFVAPNEALGRSLIIGLWHADGIEEKVRLNCLATHHDSRCVAAAAVIATMAHELLWHREEADFDQLWGICRRIEPKAIPYIEKAHDGEISDFDLDDEDNFWSVLKTMGAALWALWHVKDPEEALRIIVHEGGDADTNAALALGLLGLKYGVNRLPSDKIEKLIGRERVQQAIDSLTPVLAEMIAKSKDDDE